MHIRDSGRSKRRPAPRGRMRYDADPSTSRAAHCMRPQPRLLDALSPVDGRYRAATEPLRGLLSEAGLIRERIRVEALWLLHLARRGAAAAGRAAAGRGAGARARSWRAIRTRGRRRGGQGDRGAHQPRRQGGRILRARGARRRRAPAPATLELVHFGCTSEDINNLSYARLLASARAQTLLATSSARIARR